MKAGVFPFNPNAIDRSRILKNNKSINTPSSTSVTSTNNTSNNNPTTNYSLSNNSKTLNATSHVLNNCPQIINGAYSPQPASSSFTSSREAISSLDRILEETKSNHSIDVEDDDDDDEEYFPSKSSFPSSNTDSSTKGQKSQPMERLATEQHQSIFSKQSKKRKKSSSKIIDFDSSDENDDVIISSPHVQSQQLPQTIRKSQGEKPSAIEQHQSIPSQQSKKRKTSNSKIIGFDTSDEDNEIVLNSPPQQSLQAIASAIQAVFAAPFKETSKKPAKRTVLDRSNGQIITEKHAIEQLEERKNKQSTKRTRSTSQNLNGKKRRIMEKNDRSDGTRSTITVRSSNPSMVALDPSVSIDISTIQHPPRPIRHLSSFSNPTFDSIEPGSDHSSSPSDYLSFIYQPLLS